MKIHMRLKFFFISSFADLCTRLRTGLRAGGMGLVCGGLHALGPDHLATLVTFSALLALVFGIHVSGFILWFMFSMLVLTAAWGTIF